MDPIVYILIGVAAIALIGFLVWRRSQADPIDLGEATTVSPPSQSSSPSPPSTGLGAAFRRVFSGAIDDSTWDQLEDVLLSADVGAGPATRIIDTVKGQRPKTADEARSLLAEAIRAQFHSGDRGLNLWGEPTVILVVGVNGAGKTTSVAKIAKLLSSQGKRVVLAAADTFRAAGGEQLEIWGDRIGVPVISGQEGGDPAAVVYDAMASARATSADVVLVDTAGRLHANRNLMEELAKVHRVAGGERSVGEVLLVLDSTAGQNGLAQVEAFGAAVPLTGVVLAKFDGTAKGGIVIAVESSLGVPVKLVGTGEGVDNLEPFDPDRFLAKLIS